MEILTDTYPPLHRQGVCIWFTGLSGAGKSATDEVLTVLFLEHGCQVTVLDGDVVQTHLSKGMGFSREDRDTIIRRIGFVAAEVVRHDGVGRKGNPDGGDASPPRIRRGNAPVYRFSVSTWTAPVSTAFIGSRRCLAERASLGKNRMPYARVWEAVAFCCKNFA